MDSYMEFRLPLQAGCMAFLLVLSGCSGGAKSASATPSQSEPQVSLSPSSLAFGNQAVGQLSAAQTVTVQNTGNAVLSVTATLNDTTNYAMTSNCGSVAPSSFCTLTLTFKPQSAASLAATVTLLDNAGGVANSTQTVTLTGTGAAAQATLSPASLTFAATAIGASATAQTVTLTNPGNATLSGIALSVTGAPAGTFPFTSTCGTTLAPAAFCTISVGFTPGTSGTFTGSLKVTDSAGNSPQTVLLFGGGTAPLATLSSTSIAFSPTGAGTTSAPSSVTLTNTGNSTLTITSITLGGTNPTSFAESTTCLATLAPQAACTITATFSPASVTSYSASIAIVDNATGSPQSIALSGTGSSSVITHTLYTVPEPDNSVTPLYALINGAAKTIDMTMYALEDTTFSGDLVADCKRGVTVRVILDQNDEKSGNTPAFNQLNAQSGCSAVWANKAFEATHEKCFIVDGTTVSIMSLNLQSQYYSTTRDFALVENDAADIAAIQTVFNADYAAGTTASGVVGASDFSSPVPPLGDDLIWSPTTAQAAMLGIINNATTTLLVENEEMGAANIVSALEAACQRGVSVHIAMVSQSSYASNFSALEAAGCGVHVYPDTTNGFYIHAKAVVADYGLKTQNVYMGSINYSLASMNNNRELGLYITDPTSVGSLNTTIAADYAGGTAY
jgi:cardiolipin synthase